MASRPTPLTRTNCDCSPTVDPWCCESLFATMIHTGTKGESITVDQGEQRMKAMTATESLTAYGYGQVHHVDARCRKSRSDTKLALQLAKPLGQRRERSEVLAITRCVCTVQRTHDFNSCQMDSMDFIIMEISFYCIQLTGRTLVQRISVFITDSSLCTTQLYCI